MNARERIMARIKVNNEGCWIWQGARTKAGYGAIRVEGRVELVHRVMCAEIPEGLVVDHLCRVRICCNPSHLEAVTTAVNLDRGTGRYAFADTCMSGKHEVKSDADVKFQTKGNKRIRVCRGCANDRERSRYHANKMSEGWSDHGYRSYRKGCRCNICTAANRERLQQWRARKKSSQQ